MKDIPNYEGKYAVTEDGQVWSYKHKKFLKPNVVGGYHHVSLVDKNNVIKQWRVHRLVAITYIPNPNNCPIINHKDENRKNNHVSNLEWCTHKYNSNYGNCRKNIGANKTVEGKKRSAEAATKARSKAVRCIETGEIFSSASLACRAIGVASNHISACCKGTRNICGGYHWEYVKEVG